jgi:hypothetical protein
MRQPHAALDGQTPLAALGAAKQDQVRAIVRRDFDRELVSMPLDEAPATGAPPIMPRKKRPAVPRA